MKILSFLYEFAELTPVQQKIFLYCLQHCRHPRKNTPDLNRIAFATGAHRKSVERAFKVFATHKILRRIVCYIKIDIKSALYAEHAEKEKLTGQSDIDHAD